MGDLLGSFSESVRVRTKHAEKIRVGLWGQSTFLKVVWDIIVSFLELSFLDLPFYASGQSTMK
jgi:hypothetical protein